VTWGSAAVAIAWLVMSILFSWYAANFGSYNKTYGSLGAVIGFMTWIWLSPTVVLLGAELDAEMEHQTARDTTTGPAGPAWRTSGGYRRPSTRLSRAAAAGGLRRLHQRPGPSKMTTAKTASKSGARKVAGPNAKWRHCIGSLPSRPGSRSSPTRSSEPD
jgi:hypothetical protein